MSDYTVRAVRWDGGWELHIQGVGLTQAGTLASADRMIRSYLSLDGHDAAAARISVIPDLGADLSGEVQRAQEAVADAERRQREAAALSRKAVSHLKAAGLNGADIAAVLNVSPQRVSQLLHN